MIALVYFLLSWQIKLQRNQGDLTHDSKGCEILKHRVGNQFDSDVGLTWPCFTMTQLRLPTQSCENVIYSWKWCLQHLPQKVLLALKILPLWWLISHTTHESQGTNRKPSNSHYSSTERILQAMVEAKDMAVT